MCQCGTDIGNFGAFGVIGKLASSLSSLLSGWYASANGAGTSKDRAQVFAGKICVNHMGFQLPMEMISAMVLKNLKQTAETRLSEKVTKAVITVPAYFTDAQIRSTMIAGQIAGLEVMQLVKEPTAAALSYAMKLKNFRVSEMLLVFDLGGGTFDVSILQLKKGNFEVLAVNGDSMLGGEDFDQVLADYLLGEFKLRAGQTQVSPRTRARFLKAAEGAKRRLSSSMMTDVVVEGVIDGDDFHVRLTRAKFEKIAHVLFQRLLPIVDKALRQASLHTSDIDRLLLVGGSSRMPRISELLEEHFGRQPDSSLNVDEAVADGAAILAFRLANPSFASQQSTGLDSSWGLINTVAAALDTVGLTDVSNMLMPIDQPSSRVALVQLNDISPHTIGLSVRLCEGKTREIFEGCQQISDPLIPRGHKLPYSLPAPKQYTTIQDYQTTVLLEVYEGEEKLAADNILLGSFKLTGITRALRGLPKIEVSFAVDRDGMLQISARDSLSNVENSMQIRGSSQLDAAEAKAWSDDLEAMMSGKPKEEL